jgi:thymidylate synthase (FAD)
MRKIEVKILNPEAAKDAERMMVCAARLTQRGERVKNMADLTALMEKAYKAEMADALAELPHNTIRQFQTINVAVVGASRRFLAQITRRRVGVAFASASLQYSDYSNEADFTVPYDIIERGEQGISHYLSVCAASMAGYEDAIKQGIGNDAAGYMAPQALRNVLLIGATPQAWIEMVRQRTCRRNTAETRYVLLLIWRELERLLPGFFRLAGPSCLCGGCVEGAMSCQKPIQKTRGTPAAMIEDDFPLLAPQIGDQLIES